MKRLLVVLLVLGVLGCGSKKDAETPDAAAKNALTPDQLALGNPLVNRIGIVLVPIPAGEFTMGSGSTTIYQEHPVKITKPFHLGAFEVTQEQYEKVTGKNPSYFKGPNNPVELVSWKDAVEFCRRLSELPEEKAAGHVYRLPTEAEWEYACRAGTTAVYSFGDDESQLGQYAWFDENSGTTTHPVGEKKPNPWGLYDMHGNVDEWCQDWHGEYPSEPVTDPTGPTTGSYRMLRGGSRFFNAWFCRSGYRDWSYPPYRSDGLGFRVARGPSASQ
jgi:formylglycine-generating enzyme required for sulfatase activity